MQTYYAGCSKMLRCKALEILRSEAYWDVRRNKPAPCLTRGRMRGGVATNKERLIAMSPRW
jgi:hypothetical protein